jgi:hypothetical protein
MDVQVNWLAVLLAAASTMVVGSVWYSPKVFGKMWEEMVKLDKAKAEKGAAAAIGLTALVSLVSAYVLSHVAYLSNAFFHGPFLQDALSTAFWVWLGFVAARIITHDAFEGRRRKLTALNIAHEFVTFMVMGLIIGLMPPA